MEFASRIYRGWSCLKLTRSFRHLKQLSRYPCVVLDQLAVDSRGHLGIKGTNIKLQDPRYDFLLRGSELVRDLRKHCGANFYTGDDKRVIVEVGGIRLSLETWEELFIAHEVFYKGIYNFAIGHPFCLIDVGMNTATTALYYSSNPMCTRIESFELFPSTVARAKSNISLNPDFAKKIAIHPYGLGAHDAVLDLEYFPDMKGSVGLKGLPSYAYRKDERPASCSESVKVRNAALVYEEILRSTGATDVVCKLDCEGSEYEIVRSLDSAGLLPRIRLWMIEWHESGVDELKQTFVKNGFACLSLDEISANHGMLYAFKQNADR